MVELLSIQKVMLYEPQESTPPASVRAQVPAQFQVQQARLTSQGEPDAGAGGESAGKRPYDEYVEEPPKTPIGLYRVVSDEEGAPAVEFDGPESAGDAALREEEPKTVSSTDDVDREIEALRARRDRLKLKIAAAGPEQAELLRQQLAHLEQELLWKDSDTYRQRHAKVVEK